MDYVSKNIKGRLRSKEKGKILDQDKKDIETK